MIVSRAHDINFFVRRYALENATIYFADVKALNSLKIQSQARQLMQMF